MPKYRPTPLQRVAYPLTGGVDTKIHGHVLPAPKLQSAINVYVEQTGSIRRRSGRLDLTTSVQDGTTVNGSPAALATYKGNLLQFTTDSSSNSIGGKAYEYSETVSKWVDKGTAESIRIRSQGVAKDNSAAVFQGDAATANGITVVGYTEYYQSSSTCAVRITVLDANGVVIKKPYTLLSAGNFGDLGVKVVARGNNVYVFWVDPSTNNLRVAILNCTSSATLGTMEPTPVTVVGLNGTTLLFDVCSNSTYGVFCVYDDTTANQVSFGFVDTSGALGSTSTSATNVGTITNLACDVAPANAQHAICYTLGTAPNDVYAQHRSFNGSVWSATATSGALDTAVFSVAALACKYSSVTTLRVFYTENDASNVDHVYQATYTTAGVPASRVVATRRATLISKPVRVADGRIYFWAQHNAGDVYRDFLIREDGLVVAKAVEVGALVIGNSILGLPQIEASGDSYTAVLGYVAGAVGSDIQTNLTLFAQRRVTFDLIHSQSYANTEYGEELALAGGFLQSYDGDGFVENNFLHPFPSGVADPTPSAVGGTRLTLLAEYSYIFIYESTDKRGTRALGTYIEVISAPALTGANDTHTFSLPTLHMTQKKSPRADCVIGAYRTLANPTEDSPHHRIATIKNDPTVDSVTFVDSVSDATAALNETLYLDSGEVENTAPPSAYLMAAGNGRVYLGGFADFPNRVMASKTQVDGRELSFSDFLPTIEFPQTGGPITAIACFAGFLVGFKENQIYRVGGDGPNNAGFGEWPQPELLHADTGTLNSRSVVVTPIGIFFEGVKGIMLLDQAFQVSYVGAPLEKLTPDPGTCHGATLVPLQQHVRFSYDAITYVFDYYHKQWYTWTHGSDAMTVVWNDVLAAGEGTTVLYENAIAYDDAGTDYACTLKLGWARASDSLHGDIRVRKIGLTGESLNAHYLSVIIRHDFSTSITQTIDEQILSSGILRREWRLSREVGAAVEVTIRDAVLDAYGADVVNDTQGWRLNELVFEIGVRSEQIGR
jgi:hypothetical protein